MFSAPTPSLWSQPPSMTIFVHKDQGWRRHVEIPNVSVQVQHVPYSGRQYRDTHDDSVWISNEHPGYTPHAYLGGPPPLPPVAPIPLPPLSPTTPIQTHPLITYRLHHAKVNSPILWNISLPPSTARLAAALNSAPSWPWWQEVAVWPNGLPSMTIRVQGVQRPIVVFPLSSWRPTQASRAPHTSYFGRGQTMSTKSSTL